MYAIMGITGQVGGATARTLLAQGKAVRAIVHGPEKAAAWVRPGVEIAAADYNDPAALGSALKGVEGAFVMIPANFAPRPDFPEARAAVEALRRALETAQPPKMIYLSSVGAHQTSGLGLITSLHIFEQGVSSLLMPAAFLRAAWFMENSLWDIQPARDKDEIFSFLQPLDQVFQMISTEDIGRIAAETLQQEWTGKRYLEIEGPRRYSFEDVGKALSKLLKKPVKVTAVPRERWASLFVEQGAPPDRVQYRIEMLDGFNSHWIDFQLKGTEHILGRVPLEDALQALVASAS